MIAIEPALVLHDCLVLVLVLELTLALLASARGGGNIMMW